MDLAMALTEHRCPAGLALAVSGVGHDLWRQRAPAGAKALPQPLPLRSAPGPGPGRGVSAGPQRVPKGPDSWARRARAGGGLPGAPGEWEVGEVLQLEEGTDPAP